MIHYIDSAESLSVENLTDFFVGWPNPPSPQTHLELLRRSDEIVLAMDARNSRVVGFITAVTDHILSAYIPLLEVLPTYQGQGIGKELVRRMLEKLNGLYMVDLLCDQELLLFYSQFGMTPGVGATIRNYGNQSGLRH